MTELDVAPDHKVATSPPSVDTLQTLIEISRPESNNLGLILDYTGQQLLVIAHAKTSKGETTYYVGDSKTYLEHLVSKTSLLDEGTCHAAIYALETLEQWNSTLRNAFGDLDLEDKIMDTVRLVLHDNGKRIYSLDAPWASLSPGFCFAAAIAERTGSSTSTNQMALPFRKTDWVARGTPPPLMTP
jgi:hypothetical protein